MCNVCYIVVVILLNGKSQLTDTLYVAFVFTLDYEYIRPIYTENSLVRYNATGISLCHVFLHAIA